MAQYIVTVPKLNKRTRVPAFLPDNNHIAGTVFQNFIFDAEEVAVVPNPSLGKWYKDRDNHFYWGGGLDVSEESVDENAPELATPDNSVLEIIDITPLIKRKIEQVINAFETGKAEGNYGELVKLRDHQDSETGTRIVQVTYGRSQTTEFGHLKSLIQDYVQSNGMFSEQLRPFLDRIGKKPSLATDDIFCNLLKQAGKTDSIMKICQDRLFEAKYYLPAHNWFSLNGFTLPLSMLVIYDSFIHSGGILSFLRKKFDTVVPLNGGKEKDWINNYVIARHNWLTNHSDALLRKTNYRTRCLKEQIDHNNWDLTQTINANGVNIG